MKPINTVKLIILLFMIFPIILKPQAQKIRIACVGNSITQGFGTSDPRSYPQQMGALLGDHYVVKNFGVGGRTLLKKGDYPYWNEPAFLEAQDFDPHIVIIKLGTNDSKPQNWVYKNEFFSDYVDMVRAFRKNGRDPQIFICHPCPVVQDNFGITNSIVRDEIIPLADSVRKMMNSFLIDFYYTMLGKTGVISSDGVHPTEDGYKLMGQIAYDAIQKGPSGVARYFYANKPNYEKGDTVKLYWETTKGSSVTINGVKVNETDSMQIVPDSPVYTLIAKGDFTDTIKINLSYLAPGKIKSFTAFPAFLDLGLGDTTQITWSATNGSQVTLDGIAVQTSGVALVSPKATKTYTLIANGNSTDTAFVTIQVIESDKINRALKHSVSSSVSARGYSPEATVDGDPNTSWVSGTGTSHYIKIDLGKNYQINKAVINWGKTYGKLYRLEAQTDVSQSPVVIYSNLSGKGGVEEITGIKGEGRYLRLLCLSKAGLTDSAYVINEISIYGTPAQTTDVKANQAQPLSFRLGQNYPNPFNPQTKIEFELAKKTMVSLKVYDITGHEIAVLENKELSEGKHSVSFNAMNFASGIYFYRLTTPEFSQTRSMMVIK